jgi:hypothetical protein
VKFTRRLTLEVLEHTVTPRWLRRAARQAAWWQRLAAVLGLVVVLIWAGNRYPRLERWLDRFGGWLDPDFETRQTSPHF